MIDLIGVYLPVESHLVTAQGELIRRVEAPTKEGKPLEVAYRLGFTTVRGSLPKFWKGNNILPLTMEEQTEALEFIARSLGPGFLKAQVGQLEVGTTLAVKHKPPVYTLAWRSFQRYQWTCWRGGESVQLGNRSQAFLGYDKQLETGLRFPVPGFPHAQGLRLELRFRKGQALRRAVGRPVLVQDLGDKVLLEQLKEAWRSFYFSIPKSPRPLTNLAGVTPAEAKGAWARMGLDALGWDYVRALIKDAQQAGELDRTSSSRMRGTKRYLLATAALLDRDPLIEELDEAVRSA